MLKKSSRRFVFLLSILSSVLVLSSCQQSSSELTFQLQFQQKTLTCQNSFLAKSLTSAESAPWFYQQALFFVSNLEQQTSSGEWLPIELASNSYQSDGVVLIGDVCGDDIKNWQAKFSKPSLTGNSKIRFTIGVPFELNHQNPLTQASPLNLSSMFWVWQTGHKFVRIELYQQTDDIEDSWLFHLGSTGCSAVSPVRSPSKACRYPNRVDVEIDFPSNGKITIDLAQLLKQVKLGSDNSCQSSQENPSCKQLFSNLFSSEQQVFYGSN